MREQLTINGIGTYDDLGLIILATPEFKPPTPKTYTVDVPGGNGVIDLTEYGGDIAYSNRSFEFDLLMPDDMEFTRLYTLWHGRKLSFVCSWDADYIYTGRFAVSKTDDEYRYKTVTLTITADPYKVRYDSPLTWLINAAGGVEITLPVGRKRVCPTIEVQRESLVSHNGKTWTLEAGASKIRDLWLTYGDNVITINTYPTYSIDSWADLGATKTWAEIATKTWATVAAGDTPPQASDTWAQHAGVTWATIGTRRWVELSHGAETGDEYAAYIQYDYQDL